MYEIHIKTTEATVWSYLMVEKAGISQVQVKYFILKGPSHALCEQAKKAAITSFRIEATVNISLLA